MEITITFDDDEFKKVICESFTMAEKLSQHILENPEYLSVMIGNDEFMNYIRKNKYLLIQQISVLRYIDHSGLNECGIQMLYDIFDFDNDIKARTLFMQALFNIDYNNSKKFTLFRPVLLKMIYQGVSDKSINTQYSGPLIYHMCLKFDIDFIKTYIDACPESLELCTHEFNPIYTACRSGDADIVRYLLTFDCLRKNFSVYNCGMDYNSLKDQSVFLKIFQIFLYEYPDLKLTRAKSNKTKLNEISTVISRFFSYESTINDFLELLKRYDYDLQSADFDFFVNVFKTFNPQILQYVLDNTTINLNSVYHDETIISRLGHNVCPDACRMECLKILLRSGRYEISKGDIERIQIIDEELFNLIYSICDEMTRDTLVSHYNKILQRSDPDHYASDDDYYHSEPCSHSDIASDDNGYRSDSCSHSDISDD